MLKRGCVVAERFLGLSLEERSEILSAKARELGRRAMVLEKDVWVCWVLEKLFSIPEMPRMAFKGGTSLSKVYRAIYRFSEDVDITFDYRDLRQSLGFDDDPQKMSGERLRKFREALQSAVSRLVHERVVPSLQQALREEAGATVAPPEVDGLGEKVKVFFPTVLERDDYIKEWVLLEFGGRNLTEPCSSHRIKPDIAEHLPQLRFPAAKAIVLSPERTFWEKATLIHAECCRGALRATADRPSRHWYDLAALADHEIGHKALRDRDLFASVVEHKSWAFKDPKAHYERCLTGELRLVPENEPMRRSLEEDFNAMVRSGMFYSPPPTFPQIEARLELLATSINV
jgi:hypothetical protein